jgi:hypothetical protein
MNRLLMIHYRLNHCSLMASNRMSRLGHWSRLGLSCLSSLNYLKIRFESHYPTNRYPTNRYPTNRYPTNRCRTNRCRTNHCRTNHCRTNLTYPKCRSNQTSLNYRRNRNCRMSHSIPMNLNCHWNQSYLMSRSTLTIHCHLSSHWIRSSRSTRSIRLFPSCRFVWRSHHFHWLHCFRIRSRMNHCYHSIPKSRLNPMNLTSH